MTIKESIAQEMYLLSLYPKSVFLGENIINSGRIYGTLNLTPIKKCIEMPVAENLIAGASIGLSFSGHIPICIFQRMDFMFIAADAIINHACMLPRMSGGSVKCGVIFRTIQASPLTNKFYIGLQHSKDLSYVFEPYMKVIKIPNVTPKKAYAEALKVAKSGLPVLVVERYGSFNEPLKKERER